MNEGCEEATGALEVLLRYPSEQVCDAPLLWIQHVGEQEDRSEGAEVIGTEVSELVESEIPLLVELCRNECARYYKAHVAMYESLPSRCEE